MKKYREESLKNFIPEKEKNQRTIRIHKKSCLRIRAI